MNMKKTTLTLIGIAAVLALVAVPILHAGIGHAHAHGMGFGPLGHLDKVKAELGLSDQQVTDIKAIFKSVHDQNAQLKQQLHGGFHDALATLIKNPNDVAGAQAIIDQQAQAENTLKTNVLMGASKALNVLTPDQRVKLGDLVAKWQQKAQQRSDR